MGRKESNQTNNPLRWGNFRLVKFLSQVAAIKELLKKQKEEEERLQREEDERIRKEEEAIKLREEQVIL